MCGLITVQWCKIKLEADIFLKEFEIKIILEEMLIKEKTCNKGRMVCIYGHKGHAFLHALCCTYFLRMRLQTQ